MLRMTRNSRQKDTKGSLCVVLCEPSGELFLHLCLINNVGDTNCRRNAIVSVELIGEVRHGDDKIAIETNQGVQITVLSLNSWKSPYLHGSKPVRGTSYQPLQPAFLCVNKVHNIFW